MRCMANKDAGPPLAAGRIVVCLLGLNPLRAGIARHLLRRADDDVRWCQHQLAEEGKLGIRSR